MKKLSTYFAILLLLSLTLLLLSYFGAFAVYIKSGGEKLKPLHAFVNTLIEVPHILKPGQFAKNIKQFIDPSVDLRAELPSNALGQKHANRSQITVEEKSNFTSNDLILISRFDGNYNRSIVEIRRLDNLALLHTYNIDPKKILENFDKGNNPLFKHIERDLEPNRFLIIHPWFLMMDL